MSGRTSKLDRRVELNETLVLCIIAKINGHAMGLGAPIALFCDIIFAASLYF